MAAALVTISSTSEDLVLVIPKHPTETSSLPEVSHAELSDAYTI